MIPCFKKKVMLICHMGKKMAESLSPMKVHLDFYVKDVWKSTLYSTTVFLLQTNPRKKNKQLTKQTIVNVGRR